MSDFKKILTTDQQAIDTDIAKYVEYLKESTKEQYSEGSQLAMDAYCDILTRGGKRLRGVLVIEGYKMSGGTNMAMIMQAARATEMIHAALLIIDDIQDRSTTRRGGPAAHIQLNQTLKDEHLAETLATNSALLGIHAAMMILSNLDAPAELRANLLSILNRTLLITIHGQIADPMNERNPDATEADVTKVQEWKTATYTILNPLHMGMVLAGAGCEVTDGVTPYAHAVGQAFQITDDIIGTFGKESETGKNITDDIRDGKRTLLVVHALENASKENKKFLLNCLGNKSLTDRDFKKVQQIIIETGSLDYAKERASSYVESALISLEANKKQWSKEGNTFLKELAQYLLNRIS